MNNKNTFKMISDPGHAWLEVPLDLLKTLGIDRHITTCSYLNNGLAYLEEDLDFGSFIAACRRECITVTIKEVYQERTPIRGYRRYPGRD